MNESYDPLLELAGRVLGAPRRDPPILRVEQVIADYEESPNVLLLCARADGSGHLVLKKAKQPQGHLLHDAAGLTLLGNSPKTADLVPRLYGLDPEQELLLLEDLGAAGENQLGWILVGPDPVRAQEALTHSQTALARLHGETLSRREEFEGILAGLRPGGNSRHRIHEILPRLRDLSRMPTLLGLPEPSGLGEEIEGCAAILREPGPFLGLTHGDATPANCFTHPGGARFFDFETCAYRHVLLDGTYSRIRYLHSVWAYRIPLPLQQRLFQVYRAELGRWIPQANDDALYSRHFAACSAAWLGGLCGFLSEALPADRKWGRTTLRQRILAGMEHFIRLAGELGELPALAGAADIWQAELSRRWDDVPEFPVYPALAGPSG